MKGRTPLKKKKKILFLVSIKAFHYLQRAIQKIKKSMQKLKMDFFYGETRGIHVIKGISPLNSTLERGSLWDVLSQ